MLPTDNNKIRMLLACSGLMVIAVTLFGLSLILQCVYIIKKSNKNTDKRLCNACVLMSYIGCKLSNA